MDPLTTGAGTILSFGELLLRISPDADGRWLSENVLPFYIGGAELNVATALALWGLPSGYFTALPDNGLSGQIVDYLQTKNIGTSAVHFSGNRLGLYFLTQGQDLKHDALIYDRAGSSFSTLKPGMVDWDKALNGVSWFHFSAICPAVSQDAADMCMEVLKVASAKKITVSVDLNYRSKLWKYGKSPVEIMPELMPYCDLIMGNIWAADKMLGIPVSGDVSADSSKESYLAAALDTSQEIVRRYPGCRAVANTFRFDSGDKLNYYTTLYTSGELFTSNEYIAGDIVDKVGSGDCFMAGLIYGFYNKYAAKDIVEFATVAAYGKLFVKSDATNQSVEEIKRSIKNG